jgi:hypothetical protein
VLSEDPDLQYRVLPEDPDRGGMTFGWITFLMAAVRGYGPLLYDLAAYFAGGRIYASEERSADALRLWSRHPVDPITGYPYIEPMSDAQFATKYGVSPLTLLRSDATTQDLEDLFDIASEVAYEAAPEAAAGRSVSFPREKVRANPPSRVNDIFRRLHDDVCDRVAPIDVRLVIGREVEFPLVRNCAYCMATDPITIVLAPKLVHADKDRVEAVLRHEFGHAVDFAAGEKNITQLARNVGYPMPNTPERRADAIALLVWGKPIRYDADTIQSLCRGVSPRPAYLGL